MGIRDSINEICKKHGATSNVVASVELTRFNKKKNIIITTLQPYDAQYLQNNLTLWDSIIPARFSHTLINNNWHKVAIHGVPVRSH